MRTASLLLFALFALLTHAAHADGEGQPEAQYLRQRWGAQEGFTGSPNTIAQTPDGYLWAGTDHGLLRFNGQEWLPIQPEDKSLRPVDHVISLVLDSQGVLWIWMEGTRVILYQNGHFREAFQSEADERAVTALARGAQGDILMSHAGQHIIRLKSAGMEEIGRSPGPVIVSLAETMDKRVWLGTKNIGLYYLDNKKALPLAGIPSDSKVNCLLATKDGHLWIGTDHGLWLWDGSKLATDPIPQSLRRADIRALTEDRQGNLWVGTEHGLIRFDGHQAFALPDETGATTALFTDREGNIWFADAHGIDHLRHKAFTPLSDTPGFPKGNTGPIYVDPSGRTWFAMKKGGLFYLENGRVTEVRLAGLASDITYSISGRDKEVWLGRQRGGLTHLHVEDGVITDTTLHPAGPVYKSVIDTVYVSRDGSVWAGTLTDGVIHVVNGETTSYLRENGLGADAVTAIEETADGTMWFATPSHLSSFSNGKWNSFFERDGLPSNKVICLLEDGNGLWIGTQSGLAYYAAGTITSQFRKDALQRGTILGLARDRAGALWLSTTEQVYSLDAHLLRNHLTTSVEGHIYGASDGLLGQSVVGRGHSLIADTQGHLWLSATSGLYVIDSTVATDPSEPTIANLVAIRIDGIAHAPEDDHLKVQAGRKRIEFTFVGLNFSAPEAVRYRYKLDGFDPAWSESVNQRSAIYTNLTPGTYTFHVAATNPEGGWSNREASILFTIEPLLWQRIEFRVACVVALLLAALLLYQLRMQQMAHRVNLMFEERLAERTRIAQELHDTLLQGFFSASMQLSVVAQTMPSESTSRIQLNRIVQMMGRVIDDGRNAVQGLRTPANAMHLEDCIRTVFDDLEISQSDATKQNIEVSGTPRELRSGIQDEVCRITQEAISNAHRHAQATRITVLIAYSLSALKIQIHDDGRGMDDVILADGRAGHFGLQGMRERASKLGGKLHIGSTRKTGTTVSLTIPGPVAFRRYSRNPLINRVVEFLRSRGASKYPPLPTEDAPGEGK